ncbi:unnamed protein product [Didymodactylos carnosus]|uniref:Uncharacterized protein n=1 Tax=Didymodactylos carnosus TaxID=1234261 RepID=A0A815U063_9BILA|nr:unnamed protein product [Didymodactylos carnosus]CAF4368602.1 unnamed protein product [Didymodactylos carnosus]
MSSYIGYNPTDETIIEFYKPNLPDCTFGAVTSCRDIPTIHSTLSNICLDQILKKNKLLSCMYQNVPDAPHFILQLHGSYWVVSLNTSVECFKIPIIPSDNAYKNVVMKNERILLSSASLLKVRNNTMIGCDGFNIMGKQKVITYSLII